MPLKKNDQDNVQYIEGPSLDWTMNDGLYARFKTWKIKCDLILGAELETLSEVRKCKTLIRWSGDCGITQYQSWNLEDADLTLQDIWLKFEEYCKPQSNEDRARYDLFKTISQGNQSCDEWYTTVQNQFNLCNFPNAIPKETLQKGYIPVWTA